jgi:ribonuclease HII
LPHWHIPPTLDLEQRLWAQGFRAVAGLDEAGRGTWAGPVVAASVILPYGESDLGARLAGVRDSKQLTPARREQLALRVQEHALAWGVGVVPAPEIDRIGIVRATRQAMEQALKTLRPPAEALLIDHMSLPAVALPQHSLTHGDALVLSIAAASIVAKVFRDHLMRECERCFPGYGFAQHKGYGTAQHRAALGALGPCTLHRLTFAPLRALFGSSAPAAVRQPPQQGACSSTCCCLGS